jgi:hypothetical protein
MQTTFFGSFFTSTKQDKSGVLQMDKALAVQQIYVAIFAHENWKHRLLTFIEGVSKEVFTSEQVYFAGRTELGQWIQTVGKTKFGNFTAYAALVEHHKMFHYAAANAVSLQKAGKHQEASGILTGVFENFSDAILADLLKLRDKVEAIL